MRKVYFLATFMMLGLTYESMASKPFDEPVGGPRQPARPAEGAAVPQRQRIVPEALVINQITLLGVKETLEAMTGPNEMKIRLNSIKRSLPKDPTIDQYIELLNTILTDRHNIYKEIYDDYLKSAQPKQQALSRSERLERNLEQFREQQNRLLSKLESMGVSSKLKTSVSKDFRNMNNLLVSQYDGVVVVLTHR